MECTYLPTYHLFTDKLITTNVLQKVSCGASSQDSCSFSPSNPSKQCQSPSCFTGNNSRSSAFFFQHAHASQKKNSDVSNVSGIVKAMKRENNNTLSHLMGK